MIIPQLYYIKENFLMFDGKKYENLLIEKFDF